MRIETRPLDLRSQDCDLLVLWGWQGSDRWGPTARDLDSACHGALTDVVAAGDFRGELGETGVVYPRGAIPATRVLLTGLGAPDTFDVEAMREAAGVAARKANDLRAKRLVVAVPELDRSAVPARSVAEALVEGMSLGLYRYPRNSQATPEEDTRYVEHVLLALNREGAPEIEEGARIGQIVSEAASFVRTWVNHPSNIATAPALESETRAIADRLGLRISVLDSGQLAQEQMGLLIAVGRGATAHPPRMIVLEHRPDGQSATDPIVLIGKGILFDSGGYSLKSWKSMFGMNGDMAGSAVVLGAMQAVAELGLPLHVVALAPIVENLVGPEAYKPNDVLFAKNGKSVEIRSTDAEGRLILADALCYADALNPAAVIDVATLTGSKVAALGPRTNALFCNNDQLANSLMRAGQTAGEPLWRMPLDPAYDRQLRSRVADIINSGGGTSAGSITAARFLAHFVGAWPWAHIDSAGSTSYNDSAEYTPRSYLTKGATDIPLRTLVEYLREAAGTEASVPPGEDGR